MGGEEAKKTRRMNVALRLMDWFQKLMSTTNNFSMFSSTNLEHEILQPGGKGRDISFRQSPPLISH